MLPIAHIEKGSLLRLAAVKKSAVVLKINLLQSFTIIREFRGFIRSP
jgi:hypothetical protein